MRVSRGAECLADEEASAMRERTSVYDCSGRCHDIITLTRPYRHGFTHHGRHFIAFTDEPPRCLINIVRHATLKLRIIHALIYRYEIQFTLFYLFFDDERDALLPLRLRLSF